MASFRLRMPSNASKALLNAFSTYTCPAFPERFVGLQNTGRPEHQIDVAPPGSFRASGEFLNLAGVSPGSDCSASGLDIRFRPCATPLSRSRGGAIRRLISSRIATGNRNRAAGDRDLALLAIHELSSTVTLQPSWAQSPRLCWSKLNSCVAGSWERQSPSESFLGVACGPNVRAP